MKRLLLLLLPLLPIVSEAAPKTVYVNDFGATADGITLDTQAIQKAIDQVSSKGGGTVVFRMGNYLTGQIHLKDNVELRLEGGAVILGSTDPADYSQLETKDEATGFVDPNRMGLITGYRVKNVKISGFGLIDGQGRELALRVDSLCLAGKIPDQGYIWLRERIKNDPLSQRSVYRGRPSELYRPKLLFFSECEGITIEDLHMRNSAGWGLSFNLCDGMVIRNIDFLNRAYWNNDGIDLTDCRNVVITGCSIDAADDALCLKSDLPGKCCENILLEDCDVRSSASAIKFGTASNGGFKRITIKNIRIRDTFRSAIAIESVDGGDIEDILVDGIVARNTGNAIFVRLGHRSGEKPGTVRDIVLRNISCTTLQERPDGAYDVRGPIDNTFHNAYASSITGIPGHKVQNVSLENIELVFPGGASKAMGYIPLTHPELVPEQMNAYPEYSMFGETPSWAFYVRHVDGISFKNITLTLLDDDFRPAFVFDDVTGIGLQDIRYPFWKEETPVIL